jgi:hypothetical protein
MSIEHKTEGHTFARILARHRPLMDLAPACGSPGRPGLLQACGPGQTTAGLQASPPAYI